MKRMKLLIGTCVLALGVSACGGTGKESSAENKEVDAAIAVVTHGAPDEPVYWIGLRE